jgi:hypothetical protein
MKEIAMEFVDIVFVPKIIAKQLALAVALQTGMVRCLSVFGFQGRRILSFHTLRDSNSFSPLAPYHS